LDRYHLLVEVRINVSVYLKKSVSIYLSAVVKIEKGGLKGKYYLKLQDGKCLCCQFP